MPSKYTPLEEYLRELPSTQSEVRLTFGEIETILKSRLPESAYEDDRWWNHATEGNHRNTRAWTNAGWQVREVDVKKKQAGFKRVK